MEPEARRAAAAMWDGADYDRLGELLRPAAVRLAATVADAPPGPVLDLAAGTGSVAIEVARAGRPVTALDVAPGLVATGRDRTEQQGLDVAWRVGAMDELAEDRSYAAVASSFGLIFAADPVATLVRVRDSLVPGGLLAITAWHPDGYIAAMSRAMADELDEPIRTAARAWIPWGEAATVIARLEAAGLAEVDVTDHALPWRFADAPAAVDFLFEVSPGHVAAACASGRGERLRAAVLAHLLDHGGLSGPREAVDLDATYVVVTARRPV